MAKSSLGALDSGTGGSSELSFGRPRPHSTGSTSSMCNGFLSDMVRFSPEGGPSPDAAGATEQRTSVKVRLSRQLSTSQTLQTPSNHSNSSVTSPLSDYGSSPFLLSSPDRSRLRPDGTGDSGNMHSAVHPRSRTVSLPLQGNLNHKPNCHCPACCACPERRTMPLRNCKHHRSINLSSHNSVTSLVEGGNPCSEQSSPSLPSTSPTLIRSWAHYNKPMENQYKYRRSDYYSSETESDEEMTLEPSVAMAVTMATKPCPVFSFDPAPDNCDNNSDDSTESTDSIDEKLPESECQKSPRLPLLASLSHSIPVEESDATGAVETDSSASCSHEHKILEKPVDCVLSGDMKEDISSHVFRDRFGAMIKWFSEFDDEQKNILLKKLLDDCALPQIHLLSVKMEANMHRGCPPNCQDILTWLPDDLSTKIFSYLDPVSLCQASQVCGVWQRLADELCLWRRFCCQPKWRLSKAAEHKQVISHMSSEGCIQWKWVFAERFRLRSNWLRGRCTVRTFEGHTQGISCVQFDDTRIVSGSSDKTIKVWNIRTNAPWSVQTLVGHSGTVRCLHLEGNRLVSGSTDRTIKVWDLSTQDSWSSIACKVTMIGHTDTVRCLQVDDEKVISGSYDKTLKIWELRTGVCKLTLRGHQAAVLCIHFNETKIVSGSCDKTIKVWNFVGHCMMTLTGHQDAVTCLQFDSTRIVSGSLDCNLKFWDIRTGHCVSTIDWKAAEGHTGVVRCLQADGWRLVSAADDKTLKVWNLETKQRLVTLRNHSDGVTCLQFNDFIIVSGSYDKTVKLWDFSCC